MGVLDVSVTVLAMSEEVESIDVPKSKRPKGLFFVFKVHTVF